MTTVIGMNPKPFSWSWSRLKNYRTCPRRHYSVDIAKEFKDDSEQLRWGNQVHEAMASRIAQGKPLPTVMSHYEDWPGAVLKLKESGCKTLVENKLAMTKTHGPATFFDAAAWFRGVLDVITFVPEERAAIVWDWKTGGEIKPEMEQLGLFAGLVFAHYPEVEEVLTLYVWLGHNDFTLRGYRRDGMLPLWNGLQSMLDQMQLSWRTTTYPAKPSGLCKRYCPVKSCPHFGVGDR